MSIIITGAAGGIGSVLTTKLVESGHEVWAIDDCSSGSWDNITVKSSQFHAITASILDPALNELLPWTEAQTVIHLAAISSLPECQSDPVRAFSINVTGTLQVAQWSRQSERLTRFINASTSAVYEGVREQPFHEDMIVAPHLVYSQTKLVAERYLSALRRDTGFPAVSFRFFNVFGPMQDYRRKSPPLLNYLVREIVNGRPPQLHSNGTQARDYIGVDDIVEALTIATTHEFGERDVFNLCSGHKLSVLDFVDLSREALGHSVEPVFRSSERLWEGYPELFAGRFPLAPAVVVAETEKDSLGSPLAFQQETGWLPRTSLREDVIATMRAAAERISQAE